MRTKFLQSLSVVAFLSASFLAVSSNGAIPPISELVGEMMKDRRLPAPAEIAFRHRVETDDGPVELEERVYLLGGAPRFLFRAGGKQVAAVLGARGVYKFEGGEELGGRSAVFLKNWIGKTGSEVLNQCLAEQFVRRDQLNTFRASYNPQGDPKTWRTSENVLRHDDVSLARVRGAVAVKVVGTSADSGVRRAAYFDREARGLLRLEWTENGESAVWDFDGFSKFGREGTFPSRAYYRSQNREKVRSEIAAIRPLNSRQVAEATGALKAASGEGPSGSLAKALAVLLSHR